MGNIPGPTEPFWQQLQQIRRDFLGFILSSARTYGDLVQLRPAPRNSLYLVNHPDLVHDVLVKRQELFHKTAMTRKMMGKYLGKGLVLSEDVFHRQQRRLVAPAFHRRRVAAYAQAMTELTERHLASWSDGQVVDFEAEMTTLTLRIVAKTLFGVDAEGEEIGRSMTIFADSISQRFRSLPLPEWLPIKRHRQQRQAIVTLDDAILQMIAKRRAIAERRAESGDRGDLLSMLLLAQDEESGYQMDDRQVRDELVTLYFAGHETTAKLLTWVLYLLTQHREVAEQLRGELTAVLAGRVPMLADLSKLTFLDRPLAKVNSVSFTV